MQKVYHVHFVEEICGDIYVKAKDEKEAEQKAIHSPNVDWNDDSETHVTLVEEAEDVDPEDVAE